MSAIRGLVHPNRLGQNCFVVTGGIVETHFKHIYINMTTYHTYIFILYVNIIGIYKQDLSIHL